MIERYKIILQNAVTQEMKGEIQADMGELIEIVKYNPEWTERFELEKMELASILGTEAASIEHVGSTSIPGQEAKPVIDVFIGVSPFRKKGDYDSLLDPERYHYMTTGMIGRYLYAKYTESVWTHNIHIMPYDEEFRTRKEFLLRDYLRKHPELVREYGDVKKLSAQRFGGTMEEYTRSKTDFIQKVVDAARAELGLPLQNVWED